MDKVAPEGCGSRLIPSITPLITYPLLVHQLNQFPVTLTRTADRLYLASYLMPPTADTYFPYPEPAPVPSPSKRNQKVAAAPAPPTKPKLPPVYFSVDDDLPYNAFHHDFGPLHIGHLYRFAIIFHDVLSSPDNEERPIVFWSRADSRSKWRSERPTFHRGEAAR